MPKPNRARSPGNADLYADPKARAAEIVGEIEGKGLLAEVAGYLADMWEASRAPYAALWDALAPALGEAITDIRKKFEEAAYGREVTPREMDISREPLSVETRMGFRELIAMQAAMLPNTPERADQARHEPELDGPEL